LLKKWNLFNNLLIKWLETALPDGSICWKYGKNNQIPSKSTLTQRKLPAIQHSRKLLKNRIRFFNSLRGDTLLAKIIC